jgi:ABC-type antimicrobial peptide transport system permease subunit
MALGAQCVAVLRLVVTQSGALIAFGLAVGLMGALLTTRYLRSLLFGLTPLHPPTFITVSLAVSLILATVAMLASHAPARRATRSDPLTAIRGRERQPAVATISPDADRSRL